MEEALDQIKVAGRILRIIVALFSLFIISGIILSDLYREISTRRIEVMTIKSIDSPRTCVSRRSKGFMGFFSEPRHRSSVPAHADGAGLYCGYIRTEYGTFTLPESDTWAFWDDDREEIFDRIAVGCRYETIVVGYYYGFDNMFPVQNRLSRIIADRGCKTG